MAILILGKNSKIFKNLNIESKKKNLFFFERQDLKNSLSNSNKIFVQKLKNIKTVINFIGEYKDEKKMLESNYLFLKKFFYLLNKNKKKITFIHLSSIGVYGLYNSEKKLKKLNENSMLKSINYYQKTKIKAEKLLLNERKKHSIIIIRLGPVYELNWKLRLINCLLSNKFVNILFNKSLSEGIYNFIFLKDLNLIIRNLILCKFSSSKIYNVVGNYKISKNSHNLNFRFFKKNLVVNNKISIENSLIKNKFGIKKFRQNKIFQELSY